MGVAGLAELPPHTGRGPEADEVEVVHAYGERDGAGLGFELGVEPELGDLLLRRQHRLEDAFMVGAVFDHIFPDRGDEGAVRVATSSTGKISVNFGTIFFFACVIRSLNSGFGSAIVFSFVSTPKMMDRLLVL